MEKTYCSSDQNEEEKYLCSHPFCIKQQDNKLICFNCFERHKKCRSKLHERINIDQVMQKAQQNMKSYIQIQECIMQRWESFSQKYQQDLSEQVNAIIKWQEEQMKLLKCQKEQQIYILEQNIIQAKQHYKLEKLDNLIYFYKLDLQTENELSDEFADETDKQLNHQFNEISIKGQALISKQFNFSDLFKTKKIDLQIQEYQFQDMKFEKCEIHKAKKNYVCTHKILNEENSHELSCLGCLEKRHEQVCKEKSCLKKYAKIQKEQEALQIRMKQESLKMQQKVQEELQKQMGNLCIQQKENQEQYDSLKEKLQQVEKETILKLKQKPPSKIILGNIDENLFLVTDVMIEYNLNLEYKQMKKNIGNLEEYKPQLQRMFFQINKECEQKKDLLQQMTEQNEILSQKAYMYDNLIQQSMSKIYQKEMDQIKDQITSVVKQGQEIQKLVLESKSSMSSNFIQVQFDTKQIQNSLQQFTIMENELEKINFSNIEIKENLKQQSLKLITPQEISQINNKISNVAQQTVQISQIQNSIDKVSNNISKLNISIDQIFMDNIWKIITIMIILILVRIY